MLYYDFTGQPGSNAEEHDTQPPVAVMDVDSDSSTGRKRSRVCRHRSMKLEVLGPVDFLVDPGLCEREPCRDLARNVESRPIASAHRPSNVCMRRRHTQSRRRRHCSVTNCSP
jgi:hypothetical protein